MTIASGGAVPGRSPLCGVFHERLQVSGFPFGVTAFCACQPVEHAVLLPLDDHGVAEMDHVARECRVPAAALPSLMEQLVIEEVLATWQAARDAGELSWKLGPKGPHPDSSIEDTSNRLGPADRRPR
ncbi:hypothetical protein [Streptomyces monashensis]|uniref:hypothetical protein n=1 Tax=Streptomyces monashensis TaxID=1678012 RepID=UPI001160BE54|nr:hypothetical protein [Streptomyces monashensis]